VRALAASMMCSDENESSELKHKSMSKVLSREGLKAVVLLVAVAVFDGGKVWRGGCCRRRARDAFGESATMLGSNGNQAEFTTSDSNDEGRPTTQIYISSLGFPFLRDSCLIYAAR